MYLWLDPFKDTANKFAWATFCIKCIWSLLRVNIFMIAIKICIYNSFSKSNRYIFISQYNVINYEIMIDFCFNSLLHKSHKEIFINILFVCFFDVAWLCAMWWSCPQNEINSWIHCHNYVFHVLRKWFHCKYVFACSNNKCTN